MEKTRVLYISQEIVPFLPESEISKTVRELPQGIQEGGKEIRNFMPRFGCINERRHQLHEVIRLSGMNLIINDTDHPLIIKVASIPAGKMQVYFIDNEEYFKRKAVFEDENGKPFADNDERAMFFCRGVLETVKKLGWAPDIIHCHGWMTSLMPLYIKKMYNEDPHFADSKVVFSAYGSAYEGELDSKMIGKLKMDGFEDGDIDLLKKPNCTNLSKTAINFADAIIKGSKELDGEIESYIEASKKPVLNYQAEENWIDAYSKFYDNVLEENSVLAD